jgi:hypothetical protein
MIESKLQAVLIGAAAIGMVASAVPAQALSIVLNPDSGFATAPNGAAALFGFQKAANYWNNVITTDASLHFDIHFGDLGSTVLGSTYSNTYDTLASTTYKQMEAKSESALDRVAVANLTPLTARGGVNYRGPGTDRTTGLLSAVPGSSLDNNDSYNNRYINSNTAVNKALGIGIDYGNSLFRFINDAYVDDATFKPLNVYADGDITFSSAFSFDFDPTDGISVGAYDFIGVAIHEIGHALGFVSGTDDYDYAYIDSNTAAQVDQTSVLTNLDLFRYGINAFSPSGDRQLQLDPGREAFFSIDGSTPFNYRNGLAATFSTGANYGDGAQASHWKDAYSFFSPNGCVTDLNPIGIMDPTIGACVVDSVSVNDLAAFDAIGYNVSPNVLATPGYRFTTAQAYLLPGLAPTVPEPATWTMMIAGFGMIGGALRRRRREVSTTVRFA